MGCEMQLPIIHQEFKLGLYFSSPDNFGDEISESSCSEFIHPWLAVQLGTNLFSTLRTMFVEHHMNLFSLFKCFIISSNSLTVLHGNVRPC